MTGLLAAAWPSALSSQGLPFTTPSPLTTSFEERGARSFAFSQKIGDASVLATPLVLLPWAPHQALTTRVVLPFVRKKLDPTAAGAPSFSDTGIGDVVVAAKWAFFARNRFQGTTRVALLGSFHLPTGSSKGRLSNGAVAPRPLQLGAGSGAGGLGLAGALLRGRWGLLAHLGQTQWASEEGFNPGGVTAYNAALGFRIPNYIETLDTRTLQLYLEWNGQIASRDQSGGERLEDSGGHVAYLSPGLQLVVLPQLLFEGTLQIPVIMNRNGAQPDLGVKPALGLRWLFF